jgi:hypothetical protein
MGRLALAALAVAVAAATTAALAVAFTGSSDATPKTSLTVTYWANGASGSSVKWTLRCNPAGGTLRARARACAKLKTGGRKLFAPVPRTAMCTQLWGGPQVARVTGKLAGKPLSASFSRSDGCQISRWDKLAPWLLPRGGVS